MGPDDVSSDSARQRENDNNEEDQEDEYEAESILDCRLIRQSRRKQPKQTIAQQLDSSIEANDYEFLTKWKGYPIHDATWEPFSNLKNAPVIVNDFIIAKSLPDHWRLPVSRDTQEAQEDEKEQQEKEEKGQKQPEQHQLE